MMLDAMMTGFLLTLATPVAAAPCTVPAGWATATPYRAGRSPALRFALAPGSISGLRLFHAAMVTLAVPSAHRAKADRFAGIAAIEIRRAGTITVSLSAKAYIDLVRDGAIIASVAHDGTGCGGVAKSVSFPVTPGRYLIQLTDAPTAVVRMAVTAG
jgi:hypothetical protein